MKKLLIFLGFVSTVGCIAADKITIKNVQDLTSYGENTFIYSLPRTKIIVDITAVRHYTIPGPYYQYARQFLGVSGVSSAVESWDIEHIDFITIDEPDPDYYYAVDAPNADNILTSVLAMSETGLILKVDKTNPYVQYIPDYSYYSGQQHFTDLSIKRNIADQSEAGKAKTKKSNFSPETPTGKQKGGVKTFEQKAEEAANFILKIRKRRFKLLAGQYDSFPDGEALQTSLKELDKLEQEYLSLFIGKTFNDTLTKSFYYIPKPDQDIDRFVICYFSADRGFEDSQTGGGKSLVLELKDLQLTAPLDRLGMPASASSKNCLLYRIPDKALIHIYNGSLTSIEGEIKVFQYGTLAPYCKVDK